MNRIGSEKSNGAKVHFDVSDGSKGHRLYDATRYTFLVFVFWNFSATSNGAKKLAAANSALKAFIDSCEKRVSQRQKSIRRKVGLIRAYAPTSSWGGGTTLCCKLCINGLRHRSSFGCPAHDQRDFEFATKYGLAINQVVEGRNLG